MNRKEKGNRPVLRLTKLLNTFGILRKIEAALIFLGAVFTLYFVLRHFESKTDWIIYELRPVWIGVWQFVAAGAIGFTFALISLVRARIVGYLHAEFAEALERYDSQLAGSGFDEEINEETRFVVSCYDATQPVIFSGVIGSYLNVVIGLIYTSACAWLFVRVISAS
ncbi:MAG: hypothetical protein HQL40_19820 [Alphaproteobacteria bacterium]|nr:hypothetical protein [Alphaproteobacteria bacterium]